MPEIEITIDTATGTFKSEIRGVRGPACEKTAREIRKLVGAPSVDRKTAEYFVVAETRRQINGRGGNK